MSRDASITDYHATYRHIWLVAGTIVDTTVALALYSRYAALNSNNSDLLQIMMYDLYFVRWPFAIYYLNSLIYILLVLRHPYIQTPVLDKNYS